MKIYQVHKVDPSTGQHAPILIGPAGDMQPARMPESAVEESYRTGEEHGARPLERFEDGRIQCGHFMFVPEEE
jgi:hypothetical protein